jgi:hypothetical protein
MQLSEKEAQYLKNVELTQATRQARKAPDYCAFLSAGGIPMSSVTIAQIDEHLQKLPPEKLSAVYDFVSYLLDREQPPYNMVPDVGAHETMLASEAILRRDWDRPEEDAAWAHL